MQEYGGVSNKQGEYREGNAESGRSTAHQSEGYQASQHQYAVIQPKNYGCSSKDLSDQNIATYCRVATGIYEATASNQQFQNQSGPGMIGDRNIIDRRTHSSWSINNQEPIGSGAKKKIVKSQDKRNYYSSVPRYQDRYKDSNIKADQQKKLDRNLTSESTSSLDFFVEGERMVSELCNITDTNTRPDSNNQKQSPKSNHQDEDKSKPSGSSDVLLTALDKILIHDQIPNQIVQLAIEACSDAENIAIAHHNRPCFKNIHSICAKTRSNVQKPDSAVANLHSQGIPWVIKNFIFSFVRILDGWKGVKELLSEKHDTFSRIENKYYSPNIRECFVQWQAVTKEMLTHIYKTFKCLNQGFTIEQKSFTHNYYATNSAAPRHQNQNKFQQVKSQLSVPRPVNSSPQPYNAIQPPWVQNQIQTTSQTYGEGPWPARSGITYKKLSVVQPNPHSFYPLNEPNDMDNFQKQYKCDHSSIREAKPRQSWTITNVPDFRNLEGISHTDQRELYTQLKHKMDAELGKTSGQPIIGNLPCDLLQRKEMELKAKMIPLSHVEKTLIPGMAAATEIKGCYMQKNNSCGDTKEEADFFEAWGQMVQKEPLDFITHHTHNIQIPSNVVTISNNISGPVQFIDHENDEFHEISKVYMKPGSYKVPIKPADHTSPYMQVQSSSPEVAFENTIVEDMSTLLKIKVPFPPVTLAPQSKYNLESWSSLVPRRSDDMFTDEQKIMRHLPYTRDCDPLNLLNAMTSDRAWEAAKQSAPKLMDSIHEVSKSDTDRLYDALGLGTCDEFSDDLKQLKLGMQQNEAWSSVSLNNYITNEMQSLWDQQIKNQNENSDHSEFNYNNNKFLDELKSMESDDQNNIIDRKTEEEKENPRRPNFDQTGNYVRDENHQKSSGRAKVSASGMWYHPKKKKPLSPNIVKKFENIIMNLSHLSEAVFIQHDMDIKVAPRFYEVVKYPMCLHDISTKLKSSTYYEYDQVVQDFRRIFNNVRLYLKSYSDSNMKKNVNKVSSDFEKMLNEEFQSKSENKTKIFEKTDTKNVDIHTKKDEKSETNISDTKNSDDLKSNGDDKKLHS